MLSWCYIYIYYTPIKVSTWNWCQSNKWKEQKIYSILGTNSKFWIRSSDKLMFNMSSHKRVVMFCFLGGSAIKLWQVWPNCNVLCIHVISKQQITAFYFTTNYKNKHCEILCFNNLFYYIFQYYKPIVLMKKESIFYLFNVK